MSKKNVVKKECFWVLDQHMNFVGEFDNLKDAEESAHTDSTIVDEDSYVVKLVSKVTKETTYKVEKL